MRYLAVDMTATSTPFGPALSVEIELQVQSSMRLAAPHVIRQAVAITSGAGGAEALGGAPSRGTGAAAPPASCGKLDR